MTESQNHLFCFGLGYSALHLAKDLLTQGWRISGTCRSQEKCDDLRPQGITAQLFDTDLPLQNPAALATVTHLLISIPPDKEGDVVLRQHLPELQALRDLKWVGYFSTTGVYGDRQGGWVDENTAVNPPNERSRQRVAAEQQWLDSGLPVQVFRLSGIYGPGRSAINALQHKTARCIDKPGQFFSRIHVEDIARIVQASMVRPQSGAIYNCADDEPSSQADVVEYAAGLLGMEPPPPVSFEEAELSDMARSFYQSSRKVANHKIKEELQVELKYPSYQQGLKACAEK